VRRNSILKGQPKIEHEPAGTLGIQEAIRLILKVAGQHRGMDQALGVDDTR
jgi:hypothetical protein